MAAEPQAFVLVGGAPRSGTSMLVRHLDGHPGLFVFPIEVSCLRDFACAGAAAATPEAWLADPRAQRKETVFGDAVALRAFVERLGRQGFTGAETYGEVDAGAFGRALAAQLAARRGEGLAGLLAALAGALAAASESLAQRYPEPRRLAFKLPLFVELAAPELHACLPEARFVHIRRDPVARYASVKARRLAASPGGVEGSAALDFASLHADVEIASRLCARRNAEILGERYVVVDYEQVVAGRTEAVAALAGRLGLAPDPSLGEQTVFGRRQVVPSAHGAQNDEVEAADAVRAAALRRLTSAAERDYVRRRVELAFAGPAERRLALPELAALMAEAAPHESAASAALRREAASSLDGEAWSAEASLERVWSSLRARGFALA